MQYIDFGHQSVLRRLALSLTPLLILCLLFYGRFTFPLDAEEFIKIRFCYDFLKQNSDFNLYQMHTYGHPGLFQFITFQYFKIFDLTLLNIRLFILTTEFCCYLSLIYIMIKIGFSFKERLFALTLFTLSPAFSQYHLIYTFDFLLTAFMLCGLALYIDKRTHFRIAGLLLLLFAVLVKVSALALPFSLLLFYRHPHPLNKKAELSLRFGLAALCFVAIFLGFFPHSIGLENHDNLNYWRELAREQASLATTASQKVLSLFGKSVYSFLHPIFLGPLVVILHSRIKFNLTSPLMPMLATSLMTYIFFAFFNHNLLTRDLIFFYAAGSILCALSLRELAPIANPFAIKSFISLAAIGIFLNDFISVSRSNQVKSFVSEIQTTRTDSMVLHSSQEIFALPFTGYSTKKLKTSNDWNQVSHFIKCYHMGIVARPDDRNIILSVDSNNFQVLNETYIGKDKSCYLSRATRRMVYEEIVQSI